MLGLWVQEGAPPSCSYSPFFAFTSHVHFLTSPIDPFVHSVNDLGFWSSPNTLPTRFFGLMIPSEFTHWLCSAHLHLPQYPFISGPYLLITVHPGWSKSFSLYYTTLLKVHTIFGLCEFPIPAVYLAGRYLSSNTFLSHDIGFQRVSLPLTSAVINNTYISKVVRAIFQSAHPNSWIETTISRKKCQFSSLKVLVEGSLLQLATYGV